MVSPDVYIPALTRSKIQPLPLHRAFGKARGDVLRIFGTLTVASPIRQPLTMLTERVLELDMPITGVFGGF